MERYKPMVLKDNISANIRLIELSSTGEIRKVSLGEIGLLVKRVYEGKLDDVTAAKVAMAWSSGSKKVLTKLANLKHPEIDFGIVHNKLAPAEALEIVLSNNNNPVTRSLAAAHKNAPPSVLSQSILKGGIMEKSEALSNLNSLPEDVIKEIGSNDPTVQAAIELRLRRMLRE